MDPRAENVLTSLTILGVLACVALMVVRIDSAASLDVPMQVTTSGWEHQPLFTIWRILSGDKIYVDATRVPFTIAFYNWLFYVSYTSYAGMAASLLSLEDAWLPTVLRSLTLFGVIAGTAVAYRVFVAMADLRKRREKGLALAYAVLVFAGPLVGFWGFTTRPDVWSLVFEVAALLLFWTLRLKHPLAGIVLAALSLYVAWALKQSSVMMTVAIGVYLLSTRPRRNVLVFSIPLIMGYAATLAIGGDLYLRSLTYASNVSWSFNDTLRIAINFAVKSAPVVLPVVALALVASRDRRVRRALCRNPAVRFALLAIPVVALLTLVATTKEGAAENYYFLLQFMLALATLLGWRNVRSTGESHGTTNGLRSLVPWSAGAGWAALILAVVLVFAGVQGVRSVSFHHASIMERAACLANLPGPVLTDDQYLSLPWMNPSRPAFVPNYNYPSQRAAGLAFEGGGIGGFIERRHFASLALSHERAEHDGAKLDAYEKKPTPCAGLTIWIRKTT